MKIILVLLVCSLALDLMGKREVALLPVASARFLEPVVVSLASPCHCGVYTEALGMDTDPPSLLASLAPLF